MPSTFSTSTSSAGHLPRGRSRARPSPRRTRTSSWGARSRRAKTNGRRRVPPCLPPRSPQGDGLKVRDRSGAGKKDLPRAASILISTAPPPATVTCPSNGSAPRDPIAMKLRLLKAVLGMLALLSSGVCFGSDPGPQGLPDATRFEPPLRNLIDEAVKAVNRDPGKALAWGKLAMVCHAHFLRAEARHAYSEAAKLAPSDPRWP